MSNEAHHSYMNTPFQVFEANIQTQIKRSRMGTLKLILLGIFAGVFIAGGASASGVVMHTISNVGIARFIGGIVFTIGLMMIVFIGGELFTGCCLMILGVAHKKVKVLSLLRVLTIVFCSNMIGALVVTMLVYFSGQYNYSGGLLGAYTIKVALSKTTMPFGAAFCSGIMCNIFVCGAVVMSSTAREAGGKVWAIFFPIMVFVVSGFEHCVANMYFIPAGIIAKGDANYVAIAMKEYGITAQQLEQLSVKTFLVDNLIPVTLGNIVGGMALGMGLYLAYERLPKVRKKYMKHGKHHGDE